MFCKLLHAGRLLAGALRHAPPRQLIGHTTLRSHLLLLLPRAAVHTGHHLPQGGACHPAEHSTQHSAAGR